jgi:hypothetical protein
VRSIVAAIALALCVTVKSAAAGGDKELDADKDWSGWWLIYHRNSDGRLVLDKFAVAMVINNEPSPSLNFKSTGQWIGCVWLPVTKYALTNETATLTFTPPGERYTFRMRRTGPDEAEGIYLDDPQRTYLAKLTKDHAECAGYNP